MKSNKSSYFVALQTEVVFTSILQAEVALLEVDV